MSRRADPAIDQYLAAVNEVDGREADGFGIAPGWLVEDDRVGALIAAAMSTPAVNRPEQREVDTASYVRWVGEPETAWPLAHSDPLAHVDPIRAVLPRVRIEQCDRCGHGAEGYGLVTVTTPPNFITLAACDGCLSYFDPANVVRLPGPVERQARPRSAMVSQTDLQETQNPPLSSPRRGRRTTPTDFSQ